MKLKNVILIFALLMFPFMQACNVGGYSNGARTGKLTKFSNKGLICKTYEGSLTIGQTAGTTWDFSVRNEKLAQELISLIGQDVTLVYDQHYSTLTPCYSETVYIVESIRE